MYSLSSTEILLIGKGTELTVQDFGLKELSPTIGIEKACGDGILLPPISGEGIDFLDILNSVEKHYIYKALELAGGNESKAARILKINHHTFRYRRKKLP